MPLPSLPHLLRRLWARDTFVYSLRVFLALGMVMAGCWMADAMDHVLPVFLGIIACALAETDDTWRGRLRTQLAVLACFSLAALAVHASFGRPWLFALMLAAATFGLTMMGAVGERYRAVSSATLILAIYFAIALDHGGSAARGQPAWLEPALMIAGAAWYGLLSVAWAAVFAHQPVQQSLSDLFEALAGYLQLKARLFEPVRGLDMEQRRVALAQHNGEVVRALNAAKDTLFARMGDGRPGRRLARYLRLYFIAQDVHERASSSHSPYEALTAAFFHSDVLFRCQRLLSLQGRDCHRLARAIRLRQPFDKGDASRQALDDLRAAIAHLQAQGPAPRERLLHALGAVATNLATLGRQLAGAAHPHTHGAPHDSSLFDQSPRTWREAADRVRLQLAPASPLFRHAVRLSLALTAGYGVLHLVHVNQGYWIVLTTLFVCQPSYGATLSRMGQRVFGTAVGLVAGWALFRLFPSALLQAVFTVVAGTVFFAARKQRYALATGAITLVVLLCFNQAGDGYALILPRLVDTVLGAAIAGLSMLLVLPDWQARRLDQAAARAAAAHAAYLRSIVAQYATGKRDDLAYRVARRDAHNADAALSTVLANVFREPGYFRHNADAGLRYMVASHTLLNYLSSLGAHRSTLEDPSVRAPVEQVADQVAAALEEIAAALRARRLPRIDAGSGPAWAARLERLQEGEDGNAPQVVPTQLALVCRQAESLVAWAGRLAVPGPPDALPSTDLSDRPPAPA
ncbi:MAG: YccS family putative transporter [Xylophilus ampelinus]